MQELEGDPGRKWRRLARWGALACTLATVIPFENGKSLWSATDEIYSIATNGRNFRGNRPMEWLIIAFCCMAVPVFLAPPAYLQACSVNATKRWPAGQMVRRVLLILLWGLTALTPYIAVFYQLPYRSPATETPIALAISLLSAYLLICGLSFLASLRARKTPLFIFSLGTLPVGILFLAWTCFMMVLAFEIVARSGRGVRDMIALVIPLGFAGSAMLLTGWLKWWSAVKQACKSQGAVDTPPQSQPAQKSS